MERYLRLARLLAYGMDAKFSILGWRFGLSSLIDLIPGIGDIADFVIAFILIAIGVRMGLPSEDISRMTGNIIIAFIIGLIPIIGDAAYFFYRPNLRNLKILEDFAKHPVIEGHIVD